MSDYGQIPPPPGRPPAGPPSGGLPPRGFAPGGFPPGQPRSRLPLLVALVGVTLLVVTAIALTVVLIVTSDDDGDSGGDRRAEPSSTASETTGAESDSTDAPTPIPPSSDELADIVGTWKGTYSCDQGDIALELVVSEDPSTGNPAAVFSFGPSPDAPDVPEGSFEMEGTLSAGGILTLHATDWIEQPDGYTTVGLEALVSDAAQGMMTGAVFDSTECWTFEVAQH